MQGYALVEQSDCISFFTPFITAQDAISKAERRLSGGIAAARKQHIFNPCDTPPLSLKSEFLSVEYNYHQKVKDLGLFNALQMSEDEVGSVGDFSKPVLR